MLGMAVSAAVLRLQPWIRISTPFLAAKFIRIYAAGNRWIAWKLYKPMDDLIGRNETLFPFNSGNRGTSNSLKERWADSPFHDKPYRYADGALPGFCLF
jgi:hypothetical protein